MKHLLKLALAVALLFSVSTSYGQIQKDTAKASMKMQTKDYVTMKDGKVKEYKSGKWVDLAGNFTCTDGSKVAPDGTVTLPDGTFRKLNDGEMVHKDGSVTTNSGKPKDTPDMEVDSAKLKNNMPPK